MANFTPQEIEQFLQEFFDVVGARQYVGARYVPIFGRAGEDTVEWDDGAPYEPLTVVMHQGVSYVSRRYVPRGVQITDTDYWVETYRFNAQVEQYRQEVLGFSERIDAISQTMESDYVPFPIAPASKYGSMGQVLSTLANGETVWQDPVVPSDEQATEIIEAWLEAHPEATTTVEDDSITTAKLKNGIVTYDKLATELKDNDTLIKESYAPIHLMKDASKNMLIGAAYEPNHFYSTAKQYNADYLLFTLTVNTTTEYAFYGVRYIANDGGVILNANQSTRYMQAFATAGEIYVSVRKEMLDVAYFGDAKDYTIDLMPLFGNCRINPDAIPYDISIMPTSLNGVTIKDGTNILVSGYKIEGHYISIDTNNHLVQGVNVAYDCYVIPITPGATYTCNESMRFVTIPNMSLAQARDPLLYLQNASQFTAPSGATIACVTLSTSYVNPYLAKGTTAPTETRYLWPQLESMTENRVYGHGHKTVMGNMSDGTVLSIPKNNVKKNNTYSFTGAISTFGTLLIGHGKTSYDSSYITIDDTKIRAHTYLSSDSYVDYAHGITISDYISVTIEVKKGTARVSIMSNGEVFTQDDVAWRGDSNDAIFAESSGSTLTNCTFTWSSSDLRCALWAFGDSYFTIVDDARWPYYLVQNGYGDNVLLNGYPGENSTSSIQSLINMIQELGIPKQIFWALGMNDGSDSGGTPASTWVTGVNDLLAICSQYGIEPIFATIPTVPDRNNEAKNDWVRNSGYRYVDLARAVGANSSGVWYSGMLSGDNVHPSVIGAKALYFGVMAGLPEITYTRP